MPTVWRSTLPDIDSTPTLVHEEIFGRAWRWPNLAALLDPVTGRALFYAELTGAARRLAGGLRARGARPGVLQTAPAPHPTGAGPIKPPEGGGVQAADHSQVSR
jgi:hypothetical protein